MIIKKVFFSKSKVLITGGTGFIGSHLTKALIVQNAEVHLFVRKNSDTRRITGLESKIQFHEIDPMNQAQVENCLKIIKPDYIFHFAQPSGHEKSVQLSFQKDLETTSHYLYHLLHAISKYSIRVSAFVHACSSTIYKWDKTTYVLSETTPLEPATLRGVIKLNERNICKYFSQYKSIPIRLGRVFRAFGPLDAHHKLIHKTLDALNNNKEIQLNSDYYKRDYIFVDDLIDGFLRLAQTKLPAGFEVNLGSGKQYCAAEVVSCIEQITGQTVRRSNATYSKNTYDRGNYTADISLAGMVLTWKPQFSLEEGLRMTLKNYKNGRY